ncbi:Kelch domain-containing protein 3 [Thelohanellus kitauei]|uniref:Kelch domain-containing protein 3 n=1 Tax=Thelohanellus kitauei TaxID=669202 RepID=A0A0C2JTU8_THEKT|nr:Kelch domain-containing protein 3 [Thelohanellus kitauei]
MSRRNANPELENRSLHSITSVAEFLIIYGGYEKSTGSECNDLWSYNRISDIWKRYQTPIEIKDTSLSSSICSVGNLVYIFGGDGFDDHDYRQTNSLVSFNLKNSNWEILYPHTDDYDEQRPPPMCGNLLFHHNGSLYVLGGLHGSMNLDTMYKFCLKSLTWSLISQNGDKPTFDGQLYGTVCNNK